MRALPIVSLSAGTAAFIACAWVIQRSGTGYGFWLVLASPILVDMPSSLGRFLSQLNIQGPVGLQDLTGPLLMLAFGPLAVLLTVLLTLHVLRRGGRMELVAWPLLLVPLSNGMILSIVGSLFDVNTSTKGMPENLVVLLPLTLVLLALVSVALAFRASLPWLALPLTGVLRGIAAADLWLMTIFFFSPWSFAIGLLVALVAALTALVREPFGLPTRP